MVSVETESASLEGTTYVRAIVRNTRSTPQRVRLESTVPGPVWTPQCYGPVTANWEDRSWEGVVDPGRCRGVGFATPGDVDDGPLLRLASVSRADPAERSESTADRLAALPGWSPARALVGPGR